MMINNLKLAVFWGLLTGFLIQSVSIIIELLNWRIEFHRIYQGLMFSGLLFLIIFISIAITIQIMKFFFKFITPEFKNWINNLNSGEDANDLYFMLSFMIFGCYNIIIFLNMFFLDHVGFKEPSSIAYNLIALSFFILIVIILFKKTSIINFIKDSKIKNYLADTLFILIIFVSASFLLDFYSYYFSDEFDANTLFAKENNFQMENKSNVIFIMMDAVRADHMGFLGYGANNTPFLNSLAKKSVIFENAISPTSWTLSSTGAYFTGKLLKDMTLFKERILNKREKTLAEIMKENGYTTAKFITAEGIDAGSGFNQGFDYSLDRLAFFEYHYNNKADVRFVVNALDLKILSPIHRFFNILNLRKIYSSNELNKKIFSWLNNHPKTPFFLFIHYIDAHHPYDLGAEYRPKFRNTTNNLFEDQMQFIQKTKYSTENVTKDFIDYLIASYDAEIYHLDKNLENLFNKLQELALINNTLIIITADHGEEFLEHGQFSHRTVHIESAHVPLMIYHNTLKQKNIKEIISTRDIFSTILDFTNISKPTDVESETLMPLINNGTLIKKQVISENLYDYDKMAIALYYNDWKLILVDEENKHAKNSLFNLSEDPYEQKNLFNTNEHEREFLKSILFEKYNTTISTN